MSIKSLNCKSCQKILKHGDNYCSSCGAKVIRNRLTFKNLWEYFSEQLLSVDNTFFRTFVHLLTKPEVVIGGFAHGLRKRYLNPLGYLAFSILLSGIMFFVLKDGYSVSLIDENMANQKFDRIYDYQAFVTYLGLPAYAMASFLIFVDKEQYNLTEHLVINAYWMAQFSILQFLINITVFGLFEIDYTFFSYFEAMAVILYLLYILKRLYHMSFGGIFLRGLLYLPLYFIAATVSAIPIILYLFVTGDFTLGDFILRP